MDRPKRQTIIECCHAGAKQFLEVCHKRNSSTPGPIQHSFPSTKELHVLTVETHLCSSSLCLPMSLAMIWWFRGLLFSSTMPELESYADLDSGLMIIRSWTASLGWNTKRRS